jgi:hypothetical protein
MNIATNAAKSFLIRGDIGISHLSHGRSLFGHNHFGDDNRFALMGYLQLRYSRFAMTNSAHLSQHGLKLLQNTT